MENYNDTGLVSFQLRFYRAIYSTYFDMFHGDFNSFVLAWTLEYYFVIKLHESIKSSSSLIDSLEMYCCSKAMILKFYIYSFLSIFASTWYLSFEFDCQMQKTAACITTPFGFLLNRNADTQFSASQKSKVMY